ncbi:molybdopterin-dependent oxidoreductase [Caldimonas thermodepolymerans]|uniref:Nitrate reductase n=1 Tax=Caldimonas thermodepolymerans TaxID=215580 RepID=A0A2S5T2I7_9BURK|nr:nitrate reductase [Caldimonas thermodepolymerans]PPE69193.1 nitrate reductase [Caldimonas thermodepolymerans]QPC32901.1 molybdopterin-dependent oxidoreductase [Caldimonas thermodepolymerans]RDI03679.1 assimilatory nitrate reductase (NADH) alpha subunit apoprotein [Caldimonas thermodepolymerans]
MTARETRSTCPYCGVGCGVVIESDGARITGVRGDPEHPANFGRLCTKGSTLHLTAAAPVIRQARLLGPQRRAHRGATPQPVGWDAALDEAADRFADLIGRHGPDAVGFYVSGQLLTEDYYVFNKLAKGLIGTNNIDTNSRLCMSSAVAGYKQTLGADAPPACYDDVNHAELIFIAGANPAHAHPVLFRRIEDARRANPQLRLVVADPRRTETGAMADLHLPLLPGTDVALFHGLLHLLLWDGRIDHGYIERHTHGFEALKATVRDYTPREVARICGIDEAALVQAAQWFGASRATLSLYCQGLNQSTSGTAKNAALVNLHLATGQIGRPGAGPFSLTGQPNAMGGREVGGLANLLSAHRDQANPEHRAEVARLWGVPDVPATPGRTAVEMFEAAARGEIKALWIACTNPAQSLPDQRTVHRALERCEFVVVQEAFAGTATASYADLLLPATTWGEKDGTVTNSERRISRVRPAVPPPGQARHDWQVAVDFARRLEARLPRRRTDGATLFPYETPEAIWNEHRESTRGRDLDITGMSYAMLERAPQQWPLPEGASHGRARLYEDGRFPTPDGRARFADVKYAPVAEPRDARYPFSLTTGRLRDQWHGMSRTGMLGRLFGHVAEPAVELHARDMARLGLRDGDLVHVASRRGALVLPARTSGEVAPAQAWIPMHWGEEFLSGCSESGEPVYGVNALTTPACCPHSRQPELKHAAVRIAKAELPWQLLALAWLPQDEALQAREQLRVLMRRFAFASCTPFGREPQGTGLLFRAAAHEPAPAALLAGIEQVLGLAGPQTLRYADARRGQHRAMRLACAADGTRTLEACLLAGDTRAGTWIRTLLQERLPAQSYGHLLLAPGAQPPGAPPAAGRQVCTCHDVREPQILEVLAHCDGDADARLAQLQQRLRCGTQCGSCGPELKRLVRLQLAAA